MKKNNVKKIFSAFAVLAMSAAAAMATIPFTACSDDKDKASASENKQYNTITVDTAAYGTVQSRESGTKYYIAADGKQSNPGTSIDAPTTLDLIMGETSVIKPGDTIYFIPGVIKGLASCVRVEKSGEYNKYINFINAALDRAGSGYTGEATQCVLDFTDMVFDSNQRGVQIYGNYVYWYGVDICGAGDNGLYIGGSYNTIEFCEFYNNRDTGLQLGRSFSENTKIEEWPSYNLIKNCTSHNNYDNNTYGENADGFAAKLTVGYGNVFDGCIAYRNSDDGWDLYAKTDSGNIGCVIIYNCVAYENGYLEYTQRECNEKFAGTWNSNLSEDSTNKFGSNSYKTRDGDGNGFKLGGSVMEGDVYLYNSLSFMNRMHGVTDNSNPGFLKVEGVTSYDNSAAICDDPTSEYFGQIVAIENHDEHNNIDVARQTYSYNSLNRVLSVKSPMAQSLGLDEYRSSVTNSMLLSNNYTNVIDGSIDANTKQGVDDKVIGPVNTERRTGLVASEVFEKLPVEMTKTQVDGKTVTSYTYNISGLEDLYGTSDKVISSLKANRAHVTYRNPDMSINMHDILALKADFDPQLTNLPNGMTIGSTLNKTSWDQYDHFFQSDFVANLEKESQVIVERAKETLTLGIDESAVYQNFDVPTEMLNCDIEWIIPQEYEDYLSIVCDDKGEPIVDVSASDSKYITIRVERPINGTDVNVQLVAKVKSRLAADKEGAESSRTFDLTLKSGVPAIGNVVINGYDTTISGTPVDMAVFQKSVQAKYTYQTLQNIVNSSYKLGDMIIDQYTVCGEPELEVENGIYYDGRLLKDGEYVRNTFYYYQVDATSNIVEVKNFTTSNAGIYTICAMLQDLNGGSAKVAIYKVYVASTTANVEFVEQPTITVNRNGFIINGVPSSATGTLYAYTSAAENTSVTAENIATQGGVQSFTFRDTAINTQFENPNSAEYYIYYALANANGQITSELYSTKINVVEISAPQQFMAVAGGSTIGEEVPAETIYLLTNDISFKGVGYSVGKTPFRGLINGMGYTVSDLTLLGSGENTGVFYKVEGGTIENIKFNNIVIDGGAKNKAGLVSESNGGYFYNIAMTNFTVKSTGERVAGLIAQVNAGTPVYIEQVSLVNESENYFISGGGKGRTGGLVAFSQANSSLASGAIDVRMLNCYVNSLIIANYEVGGIFGTYDCGNNKNCTYYLQIESCLFAGTIKVMDASKTYAGGILGYQKGAYTNMLIEKCISVGKIFFKGGEQLVRASLKNCSGIVGCFTNTLADGIVAEVSSCVALMEEYNNAEFDVVADDMTYVDILLSRLDKKAWTYIYKNQDEGTIAAPYAILNFLEV